MFQRIYRNIYITLTLLSSLLAALIVTISVFTVSRLFYDTHISTAGQKLKWSVSSCRSYIDSVLLSTGNLAHDNTIISELNLNAGLQLSSILDNACNYALKIDAITIYSPNGRIYTSSNIAGVPELNTFIQTELFHDFITSDEPQFVSLRKDNIAKIYNNTAYNPDIGIITCCQKVYDDRNQVAGYIFADIFPANLYEYLNYSNDANFNGNLALISRGEDYFPYASNESYLQDFYQSRQQNIISKDGRMLLMTSPRDFFGGSIAIAVPLSPIRGIVVGLGVVFSLAAAVVVTGVFFLSRRIAGTVNGRLEHLLKKMETNIS